MKGWKKAGSNLGTRKNLRRKPIGKKNLQKIRKRLGARLTKWMRNGRARPNHKCLL
jgi:hypothetical protein